MNYCHFCGAELAQDSFFCVSCGKQLSIATTSGELQKEECAKKPRAKMKLIVAIAAIIGALLLAVGVVWGLLGEQNSDTTGSSKEDQTTNVNEAANAVLFLEVYDDHGNVVSTASGFVIGDGDKIVTNYHVIDNAYRIVAKTANGNASADIRTVFSYNETADLAILKLETDIGVTPLTLGDSDEMKQGDKVFAVGYPLGLSHTMSDGIVSSRYVDENGTDMLQITAPISSGNSGGALLNEKGEVVGVVTASYTDGQNLNLAVAGNTINTLLKTKRSFLLEREYIPTYTVEYVIANEEELRHKDFFVYGWINDCAYYSDDSKRTEYGWAQICSSLEEVNTEENKGAWNSVVVRYSNYDGMPCKELKEAKKGDCLLVKGRFSLYQETDASINITGRDFEILVFE